MSRTPAYTKTAGPGFLISSTCIPFPKHRHLLEQHDALARRQPAVLAHLLRTVATPTDRANLLTGKTSQIHPALRYVGQRESPSRRNVRSRPRPQLSRRAGKPERSHADKIHVQKVSPQHAPNPLVLQVRKDLLKSLRRLVAIVRWSLRPSLWVRVETLISKRSEPLPIKKLKHQLHTEDPCVVMPIWDTVARLSPPCSSHHRPVMTEHRFVVRPSARHSIRSHAHRPTSSRHAP